MLFKNTFYAACYHLRVITAYFQICVPLVLALVVYGCERGDGGVEISGAVQGTTYHIKLGAEGRTTDLDALKKNIGQLFADIDQKLSNYREDSEISRFNQQQSLDWVRVSPELTYLINLAQGVSQKTNGCFDLTIKPIFDLWGFSKTENRIPSEAEIKQALTHVGMNKVEVDASGSRLRKRDAAVQVDLSSVGQGFTVAALAKLLESAGIQNYLVEVGGEMRVKGHKSNGRPWRVAVEKPTPYTREVQRVLDFHQETGTAIMTAGTYRHFFEKNGQVYSHILNPHTGRPVTHELLSVTVLHDDPTLADIWDTALLCVGEIEATRIAEEEQLRALLVYKDTNDLREFMSTAFLQHQKDSPPSPEPVNHQNSGDVTLYRTPLLDKSNGEGSE